MSIPTVMSTVRSGGGRRRERSRATRGWDCIAPGGCARSSSAPSSDDPIRRSWKHKLTQDHLHCAKQAATATATGGVGSTIHEPVDGRAADRHHRIQIIHGIETLRTVLLGYTVRVSIEYYDTICVQPSISTREFLANVTEVGWGASVVALVVRFFKKYKYIKIFILTPGRHTRRIRLRTH